MAPVHSLPVELLIDIVELVLKASYAEEDFSEIGRNAAWRMPKANQLDKKLNRNPDSVWPIAREWRVTSFHAAAKTLRLVNREFNRLSCMILYRDVNLLAEITNLYKFQRITHNIIIPHFRHIRSLALFVDSRFSHISEELEEYSAGIISTCREVTALKLYFHDPDYEWKRVPQEVLSLVENGNLSSLGIYSQGTLNDMWESGSNSSPNKVLQSLAESEVAQTRMRCLEIAFSSITEDVFDLVRSRFPNLESMSFRKALRSSLGRIWDCDQRQKWTPYKHLRKLEFYLCENVYAVHVPEIVSIFPSLRELLISTCGDWSDIHGGPLRDDWHSQHNALCNRREPLESFHIEHMDDWEIRWLGLIPTKRLITTTLKPLHLLTELKNDFNLFPGMKTLYLPPIDENKPSNEGHRGLAHKTADVEQLEHLCEARGVTIVRDAKAIVTCFCCGRP
ncbi:hypothetical protein CPB86DRAFT_787274 [Serendipita vermifera]|nr:hypothetical protein CPB86DRAFT_787274 [Serendipita vermifera]